MPSAILGVESVALSRIEIRTMREGQLREGLGGECCRRRGQQVQPQKFKELEGGPQWPKHRGRGEAGGRWGWELGPGWIPQGLTWPSENAVSFPQGYMGSQYRILARERHNLVYYQSLPH